MKGKPKDCTALRCPTCKDEVIEAEDRPFCSERCKMVDLGKWLGGAFAIAGDPVSPQDLHRFHDSNDD